MDTTVMINAMFDAAEQDRVYLTQEEVEYQEYLDYLDEEADYFAWMGSMEMNCGQYSIDKQYPFQYNFISFTGV